MLDPKSVQDNNTTGPKKTPAWISGGVYEVKVNDIEIFTSSTGSIKPTYVVETRPVTEEGFMGFQGADGQVGKITSSFFIKEGSPLEAEEFEKLIHLAKKAGVDTDSLPKYGTFEEAAKAIAPMLKNKYVRVKVTQSWFWGKDKEGNPKEKFNLIFPKYKVEKNGNTYHFPFAENITEVKAKDTKLTYNKEDQYDNNRRGLETKPDTVETTDTTDDLPF